MPAAGESKGWITGRGPPGIEDPRARDRSAGHPAPAVVRGRVGVSGVAAIALVEFSDHGVTPPFRTDMTPLEDQRRLAAHGTAMSARRSVRAGGYLTNRKFHTPSA